MGKTQYVIVNGQLCHAELKADNYYGEYIMDAPDKSSYPSRIRYKGVQYQRLDMKTQLDMKTKSMQGRRTILAWCYKNATGGKIYVSNIDGTYRRVY